MEGMLYALCAPVLLFFWPLLLLAAPPQPHHLRSPSPVGTLFLGVFDALSALYSFKCLV
jgi:hypothetical protein